MCLFVLTMYYVCNVILRSAIIMKVELENVFSLKITLIC